MDCQSVQSYYGDALEDLSGLPEQVREHLAKCSFCQGEIERLAECRSRESSPDAANASAAELSLHMRLVNTDVKCSQIRAFLPGLLIQEICPHVPTPVTVHLDACHSCREDLQRIARLGYSPRQLLCARQYLIRQQKPDADLGQGIQVLDTIAAKPSVLATKMDCPDLSKLQARGTSNAYSVQSCPLSAGIHKNNTTRPVHRRALLRYASAAVFAAAVLLIVTWPSDVQGLDMQQVLKALADTDIIAILTFDSEGKQDRELWINNARKIHLFVQGDRETLYDYQNQIRSTYSTEGIQQEHLSSRYAFKPLELPWGLFPEITDKMQWRENSVLSQTTDPSVLVYDLIETSSDPGHSFILKRRYYLNRHTKLPSRTETWQKAIGYDEDFILLNISKIQYPSADEFSERVRKAGF